MMREVPYIIRNKQGGMIRISSTNNAMTTAKNVKSTLLQLRKWIRITMIQGDAFMFVCF